METESKNTIYPHIINGIQFTSPHPNIVSVPYSNIKNINTADLPHNLRISIVEKPASNILYNYDQILMMENVKKRVKLYILSSLNTSYILTQFMCAHRHGALKHQLLLLRPTFFPKVLLCANSPYDPEIFQLIYSIEFAHTSVMKAIEKAAMFDRSLDMQIEMPIVALKDNFNKTLGLTNNTKALYPIGSHKSLVIPTDENHRFIEISRDGIINEYKLSH